MGILAWLTAALGAEKGVTVACRWDGEPTDISAREGRVYGLRFHDGELRGYRLRDPS